MKKISPLAFLLVVIFSINAESQSIKIDSKDTLFTAKNTKGKFVECLSKNGQVYAGKFLGNDSFLSQESRLRKIEKSLFSKATKAKATGRHGLIYEKLIRTIESFSADYNACAESFDVSNEATALKLYSPQAVFNLPASKRPAIWMECSAAGSNSHYGVNSPIVFARSGYTDGAVNIRILHPICNDGPMTAVQLQQWAVTNLKDPKVDGIGIDHEGWLWSGGEATLKLLFQEANKYGKVFISIPKITLELSGRLMPGQKNFSTTARTLNAYTHGASPWCYSCDNIEYTQLMKTWRAAGYTKDILPMGDPGIRPYYGGINKAMAVKNVNTVANLGLGWALFLPNYDDGTVLSVIKKRYGAFVKPTVTGNNNNTNNSQTTGNNTSGSSTTQTNNNQTQTNTGSGSSDSNTTQTNNTQTNSGSNNSGNTTSTKAPLSSAGICQVVGKPTGLSCKAKGYAYNAQKQSIPGYNYDGYIYDISYLSYKNSKGAICRDSCTGKNR